MRYLILSLSCLLLGSALNAQDPASERLIADFIRTKALTLEYIDAMPEDRFGDRPANGSSSYAEQLLHIAQGTFGLASNASGRENPYADVDLSKDSSLQNKSVTRKLIVESFDFAIESAKRLQPANHDEVVERGPFKVTRIDWLYKAKEHITHHRGQLAVYLRLAGIDPPQFKLF